MLESQSCWNVLCTLHFLRFIIYDEIMTWALALVAFALMQGIVVTSRGPMGPGRSFEHNAGQGQCTCHSLIINGEMLVPPSDNQPYSCVQLSPSVQRASSLTDGLVP